MTLLLLAQLRDVPVVAHLGKLSDDSLQASTWRFPSVNHDPFGQMALRRLLSADRLLRLHDQLYLWGLAAKFSAPSCGQVTKWSSRVGRNSPQGPPWALARSVTAGGASGARWPEGPNGDLKCVRVVKVR